VKILITGGSGFLGRYLARHLLSQGYSVTIMLRSSSSVKGLVDIKDKISIMRVSSADQLRESILNNGADLIVHTACNYGIKGESSLEIFDVNCRFGMALLDASIAAGVTSFINVDTVLNESLNAYALSKKQFSQWGHRAGESGQIRFINVLMQYMYGPGEDSSKFVTHVLQSCLSNIPYLNLTAGEQKRDFIYIKDVVKAYTCLIHQSSKLPNVFEVDLGTGTSVTIRDFVSRIHALTSSQTELKFGGLPYRKNESMLCVADITKMFALGWKPQYTSDSGIQELIDTYTASIPLSIV